MTTSWLAPQWLLGNTLLFAAPALDAQTAPAPQTRLHYWFTAGAGLAALSDGRSLTGESGAAQVAVGTLQYRSYVFSTRWARAHASPATAWDLGLLAGLGSSPRYRVRGSVAAGVGRVESARGASGVTLPVEVQLTWRLAPAIGVGVYGFGSFTGPAEFAGATVAVQLGRLH